MIKRTHILMRMMVVLVATLLLTACSTTSKLRPGETLYTGVKKLSYISDSTQIEGSVKDQIFSAINVKPNNPLYSPYYRTPFPIGLWVYNHWDSKAKGLKGWLYKKLVSYPVLISRVRPDTRVQMINTLLQDNGYFDSEASYELHYKDSTQKMAKISYDVHVKEPYRISRVIYLDDSTHITHLIDSVAMADSYFKPGSRYCLDSLNIVRINIANILRDKGYYYYRPEYIEYRADSVEHKGQIALQMVEVPNLPPEAHEQFIANDVWVSVRGAAEQTVPDTVYLKNCTVVRMEPVHVKNSLISRNIRWRKGRPFRVSSMDRMQMLLSRTGVFSDIDMQVVPLDSVNADGKRLMNLMVSCKLDAPYEVKFEVQATSKSNSYIGPGLNIGITHKNVWGGGEQLSAKVRAGYEWLTAKGGSGGGSTNSYEFGGEISLALQRLLAPSFVDRSRRYVNWTRFSISGSILNRPNYFKMMKLGGKISWEWHANKHSLNEFTPFKLTYTKLLSKTDKFIETISANPALALSFSDVFIPMMQYNYTYDNSFGPNEITFTAGASEAGNLFSGVWRLCGAKGTKKMLGTPFSQFVKAQAQVVWKRSLGESCIAGRVFVGAAYAYANSEEVPFSEQFFVGGANSIRAFAVRSIGPGSYAPVKRDVYSFYDQTGTFKFETNWEYRFPLFSYFKGAVFVDAGNVWLLRDDPYRPGGKLTAKSFFKDMALGTGLGLRFDMQMIVVRADLGFAIHAPYDTGKSGYYNIPKFKDGIAFHLAIGYPF
ncbi:MAG: BamA/TamA family outer membrane protein [Muribaculaceae bacterium]|nr:BamA/TamA family outer membrane protein [Muribaculaceae bacterium]